jgi:myosin heavy subunit
LGKVRKKIILDSKVWVPNDAPKEYKDDKEEPLFLAQVIALDDKNKTAEVKYLNVTKNNEKVKYERIMPFVNEVDINVNDMASTEDINEIDLLNNMKNRFFKKNIQTNVGPTLIIMNPYQRMDGVYTDDKIDQFINVIGNINIVSYKRQSS